MANIIGFSTKIKDALNMIDHEGVPPILSYHGDIYMIESQGRQFGNLYYTCFEKTTPIYSVTIPYSFAQTLGDLISKGNHLRKRTEPRMVELLPEVYMEYYRAPLKPDLLNNKPIPKTIVAKD